MPTIECEFEVWCSCGYGLCNLTSNCKGGIKVEPCPKCIEAARKEGHEEGLEEGRNEEK